MQQAVKLNRGITRTTMKRFLQGRVRSSSSNSARLENVAENAKNFMNLHADAKMITAEFFFNPMIDDTNKAKAYKYQGRAIHHGLAVKMEPQSDGIYAVTFTGPRAVMHKILNSSSNGTRRSSSGSKRATSKRRH